MHCAEEHRSNMINSPYPLKNIIKLRGEEIQRIKGINTKSVL